MNLETHYLLHTFYLLYEQLVIITNLIKLLVEKSFFKINRLIVTDTNCYLKLTYFMTIN